MMPLALQGLLATVGALLGAICLYFVLTWLLDVPVRPDPTDASGVNAQRALLLNAVKISLGLAAGIAAAIAIVVQYRKMRIEESASRREDERLFSERFLEASSLLGHLSPAVRLAGVTAMVRLADDWLDQRQQCIDVLCAYFRLPDDPRAGAAANGEHEVKASIIRHLSAHLAPDASTSWSGNNLDFTGAAFAGGDLSSAVFSCDHVSFAHARFTGDFMFTGARFEGGLASFEHAEFASGKVSFERVTHARGTLSFKNANFSGGEVKFFKATFADDLAFDEATFRDGSVTFTQAAFGRMARFGHAEFEGGDVSFANAKFRHGELLMPGARFTGSKVRFEYAEFLDYHIPFMDAEFLSGVLSFNHSELVNCRVTFRTAHLNGGSIRFDETRFDSTEVSFHGARLSAGTLSFNGVRLEGTGAVHFRELEVTGGDFVGPDEIVSRIPRPDDR